VFNELDWSEFLTRELNATVHVRFGRARQRVLEARYRSRALGAPSILDLRLSAIFAQAPDDVRAAVAHWLRVGRRARKSSALLDAWIETAVAELPPVRKRPVDHFPLGHVHDLTPLIQTLVTQPGILPPLRTLPAVTWGRRGGVRAKRSLQLGCYVRENHLIRMHPVLDQSFVPEWFVSYVLFHELLHAALPAEQNARGRTVHHGPEFRRWEKNYPEYARSIVWLNQHLPKLLRSTKKMRGARLVRAEALVQVSKADRAPEISEPCAAPGWLFPC
jgi:hypothetical protein